MLFEQERRNVLYKQDLAGSPVRDLFKSEQEAGSGRTPALFGGADQELERIPVLERLRSEKGIERNSFRNMLFDELDVGRSTVQDLLFKEQEARKTPFQDEPKVETDLSKDDLDVKKPPVTDGKEEGKWAAEGRGPKGLTLA